LSFVLYVPRAAQSRLTPFTHTPDQGIRERRPGDPVCDRLLVFSLEGELFFGSEPELERHLAAIEHQAQSTVRAVVLNLKQARNPDAAFLHLLRDFHSRLSRAGVALLLWGVQPDLHKALANTGIDAQIGANRVFCVAADRGTGTCEAVELAYSLLGDDLCAICPRRHGKFPGDEPLVFVI
jgi:sulfate permease, SulP family